MKDFCIDKFNPCILARIQELNHPAVYLIFFIVLMNKTTTSRMQMRADAGGGEAASGQKNSGENRNQTARTNKDDRVGANPDRDDETSQAAESPCRAMLELAFSCFLLKKKENFKKNCDIFKL